jgi:hypothetical protein
MEMIDVDAQFEPLKVTYLLTDAGGESQMS